MKCYLHRDPSNKLQKIPYAAMQIAGLADAEELLLYTVEGSILLGRKEVSTHEAIQTITLLKQVTITLVDQLVEASNEIASQPEEREDPLNQFDETMIETLVDCGADPDGLRMLLLREESEDE